MQQLRFFIRNGFTCLPVQEHQGVKPLRIKNAIVASFWTYFIHLAILKLRAGRAVQHKRLTLYRFFFQMRQKYVKVIFVAKFSLSPV